MAQNNPEIDPHKYAQLIFDKGTKDSSIKRGEYFQQIILE